ncbi:hypothetical protein [Caldimonas sp. KR1-144]|uniref:hypothetical protein n=1 Tax=Caldimonas sp. KR1-144 TaxID=3400911 RepID=UPI003BFF55E4
MSHILAAFIGALLGLALLGGCSPRAAVEPWHYATAVEACRGELAWFTVDPRGVADNRRYAIEARCKNNTTVTGNYAVPR